MKRAEKEKVVAELKEVLKQVESVIVAEYKGMTVASTFELRKRLREKGAVMRVVKNTLLRLAAQNTPNQEVQKLLGGPIAIFYSLEDPTAAAKVLVDYAKEEQNLKIRGGVLSGELLDEKGVEQLAKLPGKDELRGQLVALFAAAIRQLLNVLTAAQRDFLNLLNARKQKLEEGAA